MSIRINEGAGGAYDPTEEGKRALKMIFSVIILMFFAGGIMSSVFESNDTIVVLTGFVPFLVIGGSIYYLYNNRARFFVRVDIPGPSIQAPEKQSAEVQQDHLEQVADLPTNEPISIDGSSQADTHKVKPKISFKLAYLITLLGMVALGAFQILANQQEVDQGLIDAFKEPVDLGGTSIPIYVFFFGIILVMALFFAIFVYSVLNAIFGGRQMLQAISVQQRTMVNKTRMRQQMAKQQISDQRANKPSGEKLIMNTDTTASSPPSQSSDNQGYCKKCYGALNPVGKCPQCDY